MQFLNRKGIALLSIAAVVFFGILLFSHNQADVDLWGNIGFVRSLPCSDSYYRVNTYSFTEPDYRWTNHEWLAEYILYQAFVHGGNPLLLILKTLIGFTLIALLYKAMQRTGCSSSFRFLYLLLVMSTIGYGFSTRPHLFTYIMLVLLIFSIKFKPGALALLAFPAGIIWTNLHGAFFIGIIVVAAYLAGLCLSGLREDGQPAGKKAALLAATLLLLICASFINPYGASIWSFISESAAKPRTFLSEWAPFHPVKDFYDHVDFIVLTVICITAFVKKPRPSLPWAIVGLLGFASALLMLRNIPLFALISVFAFAPCIAIKVGPSLDRVIRQIPETLKAALLILLISTSIAFTISSQRQHPLQIEIDHTRFPTGVFEYIKEKELQGNMLVFFDWAEYCIWEFHPQIKVFLDGRFRSAYSTQTIDVFFDFIYSRAGGMRALTDYPTSMVLIHQENPAFADMQTLPNWTLVCRDNISALFLKNDKYPELTGDTSNLPVSILKDSPAVFQ